MKIEEYWPDFFKEITEFKEIAAANNLELIDLNKSISGLLDDEFIQTATNEGIARREKILKITSFADDTLEDRRFRVLARWNDKLPYSYTVLQNKLNQLCGANGYTMLLDSGKYSLNIKIELIRKRMFDEVEKLVRQIAPANIVIKVELRYNQHSRLANLTHEQLANYTHEQLRDEVIS